MTTTTNNSSSSSSSTNDVERRNLIWKVESLYSRTNKYFYQPALVELCNISVCSRCCLRFFNIREIGLYQEPSNTLDHLINYIIEITNFNNEQSKLKQQQQEQEQVQAKIKAEDNTETSNNNNSNSNTTIEVKDVKPIKFQYDYNSLANLTNLNNSKNHN
ncbi:hypothetical protein PPL_07546 [Heterostelium album PN500]|uniref:Uncharacterized protein n=1 Tax=Heterostelium pallidum (strain ATCC 26659 / Pp 5 / PN500) TaxID=670386 RepID=D3BG95_HETP5|nr:hypothetical protein PPL_07546 [Heterostelium album PN500]EFA79495.1 hypothetical protein PPL_07546 [Heterostelium album PN500]|eukprot:XP_020431616.1 hypothetical protein PPL_07546 [Heterostelium album PN500]